MSTFLVAVNAQEGNIRFDHLSNEQGLSQSSVNCILQDRKGFMWFGTQDGLNKYDGYYFTAYTFEKLDSTSLSDNWINSLYQDSSGIIWVGTLRGGLDGYDSKKDIFTRYKYDPLDPSSLSGNTVRAIYEDKAGVLWIGTDNGLNKFDRGKKKFVRYQYDTNKKDGLCDNAIWSICEDKFSTLWIGTNGGLDAMDRKNESFFHYKNIPSEPTSLSSNQIRAIYEDKQGILWIGTIDGLNRWERKTGSFKRYQHQATNSRSLSDNSIRTIYEDRSGTLWIGTSDHGLEKFVRQDENFIHYKNDPFVASSLSNNDVLSIYEDKSGIIWIGTLNGGINKLSDKEYKFAHYENNPSDINSLSNNNIWSILVDQKGMVWIGTSGGLDKLDRKSGKFTHYKNNPLISNTISDDNVWYVGENHRGNLWLGTNHGLDEFDRVHETAKAYKHEAGNENSISGGLIWTVYEDKSDVLWIGTDNGLDRLDQKKGIFSHYKSDQSDSNSLSSNRVISIHESRGGEFWIGTFAGGLNKFDPSSGKWTQYKNDPLDPNSLSNSTIWSIYEDEKGFLWLGTSGGLNKMDPHDGKFTVYGEKQGLPNNVIYGILPDVKGNLWLSTNRGLSKFDARAGIFRNYDISDGLQSNEFDQGAYYRDDGGEMFFGGVNGFSVFHPDSVKDNPFVPPVVLTSFKKFGTPEKLAGVISELDQITLSYKDANVTFEFAALDYTNPSKNQYAYKLVGFDKDWVLAGTNHSGTYTNLDGGTYILRVKGSNNDRVWNEEGVSLRLEIVPPFWKTTWFRGVVLLGILLLLWTGHRLGLAVVQKRNKDLQAEINERHKVEQFLRTSEDRLQFFSSTTFEGVGIWMDGKIVDANEQLAAMMGYTVSEMIGKSVMDFVAPDSQELVTGNVQSGNRESYEHIAIRRDGSRFPVEVRGKEIEYRGTRARVAVVRDMTEQKRMEERLRLQFTALESAANVIVITDTQGMIIWANKAFSNLTGYSVEEAIGRNPRDLIKSGQHSPEFYRQLWETILAGEVWRGEMTNRRKDGSLYLEDLTITPVRMEANRITHFVAIKEDITERKRAENQIKGLSRVYAVLSNINKAIVRIHDSQKLFSEVCRITVEEGKFRMAWVGLVNPETHRVDVAAFAGATNDYLSKINLDLDDEKRCHGPTGEAIASAAHAISNDIENDDTMLPWREDARTLGFRSSAAFPIKVFGKIWGVFNLYSSEVEFFDTDEIGLLDELAMDLSFAVEFIQQESEHKRAEQLQSALYRIAEKAHSAVDLRELYSSIHDILSELMYARNCYIALYDPASNIVSFPYWKDERDPPSPPRQAGKALTEYVLRTGKPLLANPEELKELVGRGEVVRHGTTSLDWMGVPLKQGNNTFGVLTLQTYEEKIRYGEKEKEILTFVSQQIASAIEARRSQDAIRESEERFQTLAEISPAGIFRTDAGGRTTYVNPRWCEISGLPASKAMGDEWLSAVHPDDLELLKWTWKRAIVDHTISKAEYRFLHPDGAISWVIGHAVPEKDNTGNIIGYVGTITDITERKKAEDALMASERKYRTLVENNVDNVLVVDSAGSVLYEIPSAFPILGYSIEEVLGRNVFDFLHPADFDEARTMFTRVAAEPRSTDRTTIRARHKNGEWRWIEVSGRNLIYDPVIRGIVMTYHDITEKHVAQQVQQAVYKIARAAEAAERLDSLYRDVHRIISEVMPAENFYIALYDGQNDILSFPYFVDREDVQIPPKRPGKGLTEYVLRTGKSLLCDRALDEQLQKNGEVELVGPSSEVWLGVPLRIEQKTIGVMVVQHYTDSNAYSGRDQQMLEFVSSEVAKAIQHKQAQEAILRLNQELEERVRQRTVELVAANKELESFAYSVSHDLRGPLRAVDGFSKALLEDYDAKVDEHGRDYIRRIRAGALRMEQLIGDLLRLSRVTLGEIRRIPIELSAIVQNIASELSESDPNRQVQFIIGQAMVAEADPSLMRVVLENLVGNAWKFTSHRSKARIEFGSSTDGKETVYFLKDDGAGFDMAYANKLFGVFQRLHNTTEFPGTGIGLATVRRIIRRHGGRVWAEGAIEKGATFYFTIGKDFS